MTGDKFSNILSKKILGVVALRDRMLAYLRKLSTDLAALSWPRSGFFGLVSLTSAANDTFKFSPLVVTGMDNAGHPLRPAAALVTDVPFENNVVNPFYYIALSYCWTPDGVETNVRTGAAQYVDTLESVGQTANPNSAAVSGPGIKLVVDAVTDPGHSHAGRVVAVWLNVPLSSVWATAYEERTVQWDGVNNFIVTAGTLGQTVVSVVAGDYTVMLKGPRCTVVDISVLATVAYVGKITPNGPAATPVVFDMTGQYLLTGATAGLDEITEIDAHFDRKVCVTADALDANTPQITAKGVAGSRVFTVDEDGDVTMTTEGAGADSPVIDQRGGGGVATQQVVNGILTWTLSVAAKAYHFLGAGARMLFQGAVEAVGVLSFKDVNTAADIPFSAAAPDNALDALLPTNIIGAVNRSGDQQRLLAGVLGPGVISGLVCSNGGGLTVNISAGTCLTGGRYYSLALDTEVVPDAATSFVYVKAATIGADPFDDTTGLGLLSDEDIPLARIVTAGGVITLIEDMRTLLYDVDKRLVVTAGRCPSANFQSLAEAVAYVREYKAATGNYARAARVLVVDECIESAVPIALPPGIVIEGAGPPAVVKWSANATHLFELNGSDDVVVRDLRLEYTNAVPNAANPATRVAFVNSVAGAVQRLRLHNVHLTATGGGLAHGFLFINAGMGTLDDALLDGCTCDGATDFGVVVLAVASNRNCLRDCRFIKQGAIQAAPTSGIKANLCERWVIRGCYVSNFSNVGIDLVSCHRNTIADTTVDSTGGHGIFLDGDRNVVSACHIITCGSAAAADGIHIEGHRNHVHDCDVTQGGGAGGVGILLTAASTKNIVTGIQTNNFGITNGGGANNTVGAINVDWRNDA